jgi:uncharacterized protein (DUF2236 family)
MRGTLRRPDGELVPLGRGSLMWDIAGEYRASLVIPATLLMQVMHPMVGAAVGEHSAFRADPWGWAHRTSNSMLRYIYGGPLALQEGRRLRELHRPIEGIDARGRRYHALNGVAYVWVHCSLFERYVTVRRLFGEPLDRGQEAALYRDTRQLGRRGLLALLRRHGHQPPGTQRDHRRGVGVAAPPQASAVPVWSARANVAVSRLPARAGRTLPDRRDAPRAGP